MAPQTMDFSTGDRGKDAAADDDDDSDPFAEIGEVAEDKVAEDRRRDL